MPLELEVSLRWRLVPRLTGIPAKLEKMDGEHTAKDIQMSYGSS
jgi:hypothetical protein